MTTSPSWPADLHRVLNTGGGRQMSYVPDADTALTGLFHADRDVTCNVLTTEKERIAIAAGAWLGGGTCCRNFETCDVEFSINGFASGRLKNEICCSISPSARPSFGSSFRRPA
jgi:hypothetical protein